jgi:hypothetical protein
MTISFARDKFPPAIIRHAVLLTAFARADADERIPRDRSAREALLRRGLIPWLAGVDLDTKSPRRNIARRSDIPPEAEALIDLLVEERLLSSDTTVAMDIQAKAQGRVATIEPAHEALLRQWGLLQGWLAEDYGLLATLERVKRAARDWHANEQSEAWLADQGQRLNEAQGLDTRADIAAKLDAIDRAYLSHCQAREERLRSEAVQRQRERDQERARRLADSGALASSAQALASANRRAARRTGIGLLAALILALAATIFGLYALAQRQASEESAKEAKRQQIAAEAAQESATERETEARQNQSAALSALSAATLLASPSRAAKLALAAWPRTSTDPTQKLIVNLDALSAMRPAQPST